jgi:hypothetical protein
MYSLTCDTISTEVGWERAGMTYLNEESDGFTAIQETVVVGESEVHHLEQSVIYTRVSHGG